ncbi:MAG: DNA mismatch endonuclease Vsr [Phycisphaerales bacterium]|nr:DNA mismatch endonuclease Vsr [Phycisphaerales bacterium]
MDRITSEHRSWNMSRIRGKDSGPERAVRSLLHREGFRFRLHQRSLPGTPDIVLPRYRSVVFVHGCFWHRHAGCRFAYTPKSRQAFWSEKFRSNQARDARVVSELEAAGWRVLVVWECELRDMEQLAARLRECLIHQDRRTQGKRGAR